MRKLFIVLVAAAAILVPMQGAEAASAYSVTASVSISSIDLGKSFVLSGTVSPSAKGKTVKIQRQYAGGSWTTLVTKTLSSTSKYSVTIKPSKAGTTKYRVIKAASSTRAQGISSNRTVTVYRWRNLAGLAYTSSTQSVVFQGDLYVKGTYFANSFSIRQGEYVDWDLSGKACNRLKTYIGIDDDAISGTTGTAYITYSDLELLNTEANLAEGQSARYVLIPLGSDGVRFVPTVVSPSPSQGWLGYGSPQVHCAS
ncbi:NPCBM/NEW2 domain-containing protein [Aeromicrobium sp. 9AM]|uniref:NPCBM/NEW2 domain-containing protein n=1 Tax=Aeromicrobium sp. 9AM TaxID=2653126 RepID=UPI0012EF3049|nr:NPCBM/NEW2 domain-containing protein [Aeromicrobium sp. 9AM]VXC40684.1 conserved exported hypothetical protein [Aeromicrobium sp. 9AM]